MSGTVDLENVAGIREVYATASATVEGVALAAGDAAVFRYLAGAWTYMVVGTHTTWQGVSLTPVTANVPTANDTTNTITWTPKTGVEYVIGGSVRTPPYSVGDVTGTVTVTAQATAGYSLTGTSSWTFNFTGAGSGDVVPPTGGILTVTGSGDAGTTRTLTVTGASDPGSGLHATPYAFSTNGGTTWSAYQAANVFTKGALTAGTYQPRARVRDNAATPNVATISASDFTLTAGAVSQVTHNFSGSAGPITTVPTTTGGGTFGAPGAANVHGYLGKWYDNPMVLTGDGAASGLATGNAAGWWVVLPSSFTTKHIDAKISYTNWVPNVECRFGFGGQNGRGASVLRNQNGYEVYVTTDARVKVANAASPGAADTIRMRYDGTNLTVWSGTTQIYNGAHAIVMDNTTGSWPSGNPLPAGGAPMVGFGCTLAGSENLRVSNLVVDLLP